MSDADLTPEALQAVAELLPASATDLVGCLGVDAACALLNALPGAQVRCPKYPDRNPDGAFRWADMAEIIGDEGMARLAQRYGGDVIDIPTCHRARKELRARAVRAEFDRLTRGPERMSSARAVYAICLAFRPISARAVEMICGRGDARG